MQGTSVASNKEAHPNLAQVLARSSSPGSSQGRHQLNPRNSILTFLAQGLLFPQKPRCSFLPGRGQGVEVWSEQADPSWGSPVGWFVGVGPTQTQILTAAL